MIMIEKNKLITVGAILALVVVGVIYMMARSDDVKIGDNYQDSVVVVEDAKPVQENEESLQIPEESITEETSPVSKEFVVDSFYDSQGMWFSLKEISVKKGDTIKIKVKNIKGTHDFVIDEYGINVETPLNEEVVIEFIADKSGEFIYYCSQLGHREKGQWGTLKVSEI